MSTCSPPRNAPNVSITKSPHPWPGVRPKEIYSPLPGKRLHSPGQAVRPWAPKRSDHLQPKKQTCRHLPQWFEAEIQSFKKRVGHRTRENQLDS